MSRDPHAARILSLVDNETDSWKPPSRPALVVKPYSDLFAAFDEEDTRPLPPLEEISGVRPSPLARSNSSLPPPHPNAAKMLHTPAMELPPTIFDYETPFDREGAPEPTISLEDDSPWAPTSQPCLFEDPATGLFTAPEAPVLEVGLGRFSDSNFYTGFDPGIGSGGVFVATQRPLSLGAMVETHIHLPGCNGLVLSGSVHWTRELHTGDAPDGIGVRLAPVDYEANEVIERFMRMREPLFFPDCY